jgi:hypothetical protein
VTLYRITGRRDLPFDITLATGRRIILLKFMLISVSFNNKYDQKEGAKNDQSLLCVLGSWIWPRVLSKHVVGRCVYKLTLMYLCAFCRFCCYI